MWLMVTKNDNSLVEGACYIDLRQCNLTEIDEYFVRIDDDEPLYSVWTCGPGFSRVVKMFGEKEDAMKFALQLLRAIDLDKRGLCQHEEAPYVIDTEDIMAETY